MSFDVKTGLILLGKEQSTPSTPASGIGIYPKSDHRPYAIGSDGVEVRLDNTATLFFQATGGLTVKTGTAKVPILFPCTIESIAALLGTAGTLASVLVDVNKNGTTIFGTQSNRPTFTTGTTVATVGSFSTSTLTTGDYLSCDIDQIGSGVAGADLVLAIALRRTG